MAFVTRRCMRVAVAVADIQVSRNHDARCISLYGQSLLKVSAIVQAVNLVFLVAV